MNEDKFHGFYWIPLSCSDTLPFKRIGSDHGPFVRVSDTEISSYIYFYWTPLSHSDTKKIGSD